MTSALLKFYKTGFLCYFFLICILNMYMFFTNKINFGDLGNIVTVGNTFISKLIFKIKF
jgi:hypothetical protein